MWPQHTFADVATQHAVDTAEADIMKLMTASHAEKEAVDFLRAGQEVGAQQAGQEEEAAWQAGQEEEAAWQAGQEGVGWRLRLEADAAEAAQYFQCAEIESGKAIMMLVQLKKQLNLPKERREMVEQVVEEVQRILGRAQSVQDAADAYKELLKIDDSIVGIGAIKMTIRQYAVWANAASVDFHNKTTFEWFLREPFRELEAVDDQLWSKLLNAKKQIGLRHYPSSNELLMVKQPNRPTRLAKRRARMAAMNMAAASTASKDDPMFVELPVGMPAASSPTVEASPMLVELPVQMMTSSSTVGRWRQSADIDAMSPAFIEVPATMRESSS